MRTNFHHLVEQQAQTSGHAAALSDKKTTLTYLQLWHSIHQVGAGLQQEIGLMAGERVGIFLDKRVETVAAIFGTSAAGGVFVPINPVLRPAQVGYILADCDVRVLITSTERLTLLAEQLRDCPAVEHVVLVDAPFASTAIADPPLVGRQHRWKDVFGGQHDVRPNGVIDIDMAAILYTSGSTGRPKGVVISHRNLIVGAESVSTYLANSSADVILAALPLSFDAGLSQLSTAFSVGAHVVLHNYLLPGDLVRACTAHGVTGLTCVPPLWNQVAALTWPKDTAARIRYFANTGGRLPKATLDQLRGLFSRASPFLMYGLTEAFRSTYLDPAEVDRRPDSIGKAIPNAQILVVRPDGTSCDPGEEGELVHRGALVAMGYWNDPEKTAVRFRTIPGSTRAWRAEERAVFSGDAVVSDADGFLYFVGRSDEMIKTSGYRVSPTEIEEVAYASGLVRDAVALGVADERLGQKVVLVVSGPGPDAVDAGALSAAMRQALPLFMVPAEVIVKDELPRSPNGKFDRPLIRQELQL